MLDQHVLPLRGLVQLRLGSHKLLLGLVVPLPEICSVIEPATAAPLSSFCVILLRGREGDTGGLYAVPEKADVAREPGVDAAQLVLRVTQSLVLGRRLLLPIILTSL